MMWRPRFFTFVLHGLAAAVLGCSHSAKSRNQVELPPRPTLTTRESPGNVPSTNAASASSEGVSRPEAGGPETEETQRIKENAQNGGESKLAVDKPTTESHPVLLALDACLSDRPDEAIQHLSRYAAADQEFLLHLLPLIAKVDQGGLLTSRLSDDQIITLLEVMRSCQSLLQAAAPLRIEKLVFCGEVRGYGMYDEAKATQFRPFDRVNLYVELRNLADCPEKDGMCSTQLASVLEIRHAQGKLVWSQKPEPLEAKNQSRSIRHDHHTGISFLLPDLPPGYYTLEVRVIDQRTNRTAEKSIPFRVETMAASASSR